MTGYTYFGPKGTDWDAYDACPTCLAGPGDVCRHLVARRGKAGLGPHGHRPLYHPHKDRPRRNTKN